MARTKDHKLAYGAVTAMVSGLLLYGTYVLRFEIAPEQAQARGVTATNSNNNFGNNCSGNAHCSVNTVPASPGVKSISPETQELLRRQDVLKGLYQEYALKIAPRRVSPRSRESIAYMNTRLEENHASWRITPKNVDELFGVVVTGGTMSGVDTGVILDHSNGNTFDGNTITGTDKLANLKNSNNNHFRNNSVKKTGH